MRDRPVPCKIATERFETGNRVVHERRQQGGKYQTSPVVEPGSHVRMAVTILNTSFHLICV